MSMACIPIEGTWFCISFICVMIYYYAECPTLIFFQESKSYEMVAFGNICFEVAQLSFA